MKKKSLKLGLNKINISNLSTIKGGNGSNARGCRATLSRNFIDICCPVFGSGECPAGSVNTQCGGDPTGNCQTHEQTCICPPPTLGLEC